MRLIQNLTPANVVVEEGHFYWVRCTRFVPGATYQLDDAQVRPIVGSHKQISPIDAPFRKLQLVGASEWEVGELPTQQYPDGDPPTVGQGIQLAYNGGLGALAVTGDAATITVDGAKVGTERWSTGAFVGTVQPEYTKDGVNWLSAPFSTLLTTISANPSTLATPVVASGQTWETPLPSNAQGFRVRATAVTTPGQLTLFAGVMMGPGVIISATLRDVAAEAIGTYGPFDFSGWRAYTFKVVTGVTGTCALQTLDDTGVNSFNDVTVPVNTAANIMSGPGDSASQVQTLTGSGTWTGPWARRWQYQISALANVKSRIEVYRGA